MSNIEDRENELWGDEAKVAERVVQFFELLIKVRQAAGAGVEPQKIIDALLMIDPDQLAATDLWLTRFLWERFQAEKATLDMEKKLIPRRTTAAKNLKKKGATTRDLVLKRYLIHRDTYRTPPNDIPAKIAAEVTHGKKKKPLSLGTVENILSDWRKKGRI